MKKFLIIMLSLFVVAACGHGGQTRAQNKGAATETKVADANTVYVYYFHGKQRCVTCNTVEKVACQAVEANYASNTKVKFVLLPTDDKANKSLVERYEIAWNGLIIAKGDNSIDITEQAFGNAVKSPDALTALIKAEVEKRLQ